MKTNIAPGVEVYDNKVKKKQRHTTNEKPNMYINIFNKRNEEPILIGAKNCGQLHPRVTISK